MINIIIVNDQDNKGPLIYQTVLSLTTTNHSINNENALFRWFNNIMIKHNYPYNIKMGKLTNELVLIQIEDSKGVKQNISWDVFWGSTAKNSLILPSYQFS